MTSSTFPSTGIIIGGYLEGYPVAGDLDGIAEGDHGKGGVRRHQSHKRRQEEDEFAHLQRGDLFLEEQLDTVRYRLQKAMPARSHGAQPDLDMTDYFPFGIGRIGHGENQKNKDRDHLGKHGKIIEQRQSEQFVSHLLPFPPFFIRK